MTDAEPELNSAEETTDEHELRRRRRYRRLVMQRALLGAKTGALVVGALAALIYVVVWTVAIVVHDRFEHLQAVSDWALPMGLGALGVVMYTVLGGLCIAVLLTVAALRAIAKRRKLNHHGLRAT